VTRWRQHHRHDEIVILIVGARALWAVNMREYARMMDGRSVLFVIVGFFRTIRILLLRGFLVHTCLVVIVRLPLPFYCSRLARVHCFNNMSSYGLVVGDVIESNLILKHIQLSRRRYKIHQNTQ